jgi:hypothetical protein
MVLISIFYEINEINDNKKEITTNYVNYINKIIKSTLLIFLNLI